MTISVNVFDTAEIKEDQKTEFKTSIFVDPEYRTSGFRQMQTIADTLAAFMNAEGGMLFVGITDDRRISGIERDLDILADNPSAIALRGPRGGDEGFAYGATPDKYELKIRAIVKACLSANAREYLGSILVRKMGDKPVCRIEVKPCKPDDFVYSYHRYGAGRPEIAEIFVRSGNQKLKLEGEARDQFIRERTKRQVLANVQAVATTNPTTLVEQIMAAINQAFESGTVVTAGTEVRVEGAVALDDPHFGALGSPKGLVFDGRHVCDVKGWKGAYEALLKKLNELDAAKFDSLPEADYFRKFFVVARPRKKYPDYFKSLLGSASNIRAKEVANKIYFINPSYVVHRLLTHFRIEPHRVGLRGDDGTVNARKDSVPVRETDAPVPTPGPTPVDLVHAFTVKPLMGWLIMNGIKDVENRSKGVNPPKGTCAVSYSKGYTPDEYTGDIAYLRDEIGLGAQKIKSLPSYEELKPFCGKVVGVVDYEVAEKTSSRWYYPGCKAWKMSNPRQIANPFPITGFVNMWNLKPADAKKIQAQL